jgi:hypothetical protein
MKLEMKVILRIKISQMIYVTSLSQKFLSPHPVGSLQMMHLMLT